MGMCAKTQSCDQNESTDNMLNHEIFLIFLLLSERDH